MKSKILGLLAVALLAGPMVANAVPITYLYSGAGSGTLAGSAFAADFLISAQADTSNVGPWVNATRQNTHSSVNITIDGVGTYSFLVATHSWIADNCCGGFGLDLSSNLLTLFSLGTYNLATAFGPVFDPNGSTQNQFNNILTSGGLLTISSLRNGLTFEARVPEPGTLALLGLGLLGLGVSRRKA